MSQFSRPAADVVIQGWTQGDGTPTNLYSAIDETVASDADYVRSPLGPTSKVLVLNLSAVQDPQVGTGHVLRWRYAKDASGGAAINLTVELRQGYVNEATQGTLITNVTAFNISDSLTTFALTIPDGQADLITNYGALQLRIVADQP